MNKKGIVLSTYVYILLVFFLLVLTTLLVILNNTKTMNNKIKQGMEKTSKMHESDFSIVLLGDKYITITTCDEFTDLGYLAQTRDGKTLVAEIESDFDNEVVGNYIIKYTVTYGSYKKSVERNIEVSECK